MYWAWCSHGQVAGLFNMHGLHLFWSSHIKGSVSQAYLHICEEIHFPAGQEIWEGLRIFSSMLLNTTNFYFTCSCQTQFHMKHHWDNIIFSVLHSLFGQEPAKKMEKVDRSQSDFYFVPQEMNLTVKQARLGKGRKRREFESQWTCALEDTDTVSLCPWESSQSETKHTAPPFSISPTHLPLMMVMMKMTTMMVMMMMVIWDKTFSMAAN